MKVIISRKGFDSGYGGVASPIFPDGTMMSLPIPGASYTRYRDIQHPSADMSNLVGTLTKEKITGRTPVHFDPDLNPSSLTRKEDWVASLGQTGSAQGHLDAQKVKEGDIFLFFGWFRDIIEKDSGYCFKPKSPDLHVMFGYLQVGEILRLGSRPNEQEILKIYPWLEGHPHLHGRREENNCLYIASKNLVLDGTVTNLPGGSHFDQYNQNLCLTAPNQKSRSLWKTPSWLKPPVDENSRLSYHGDINRWTLDSEGNNLLQSVAKGQEFITELKDEKIFAHWFLSLTPSSKKIKKIRI